MVHSARWKRAGFSMRFMMANKLSLATLILLFASISLSDAKADAVDNAVRTMLRDKNIIPYGEQNIGHGYLNEEEKNIAIDMGVEKIQCAKEICSMAFSSDASQLARSAKRSIHAHAEYAFSLGNLEATAENSSQTFSSKYADTASWDLVLCHISEVDRVIAPNNPNGNLQFNNAATAALINWVGVAGWERVFGRHYVSAVYYGYSITIHVRARNSSAQSIRKAQIHLDASLDTPGGSASMSLSNSDFSSALESSGNVAVEITTTGIPNSHLSAILSGIHDVQSFKDKLPEIEAEIQATKFEPAPLACKLANYDDLLNFKHSLSADPDIDRVFQKFLSVSGSIELIDRLREGNKKWPGHPDPDPTGRAALCDQYEKELVNLRGEYSVYQQELFDYGQTLMQARDTKVKPKIPHGLKPQSLDVKLKALDDSLAKYLQLIPDEIDLSIETFRLTKAPTIGDTRYWFKFTGEKGSPMGVNDIAENDPRCGSFPPNQAHALNLSSVWKGQGGNGVSVGIVLKSGGMWNNGADPLWLHLMTNLIVNGKGGQFGSANGSPIRIDRMELAKDPNWSLDWPNPPVDLDGQGTFGVFQIRRVDPEGP